MIRYVGICTRHMGACVALSREPEPHEGRPYFKCPVEGCGKSLLIYELCAGVDQAYAEIWLTGGPDKPARTQCGQMLASGDQCPRVRAARSLFCRFHAPVVEETPGLVVTVNLDGRKIAQAFGDLT